jgi:ATP adenylyltransferase
MADNSIWSPWRSGFILKAKEKGCVFCRLAKEKKADSKNLILLQTNLCLVVMNKFPYNAGHLLVVPRRHVGTMERLTDAEALELMRLTRRAVKAMKAALKPNALNLGMNLGRLAGAGIPGHLHIHVVPRWTGDSNFMPVVGGTRVHSIPMIHLYKTIRAELDKA